MIAFPVGTGCSPDADRKWRVERISRELGLTEPYHLVSVGFVPDGGSGIAHFRNPRATGLWVLADARMLDSPSAREYHVHIASHPGWEGSRRLAFDSPAECAVVDLLALTMRSIASATVESTLVRNARLASADTAHPGRWGEWHRSLSEEEDRIWTLHRLIARVERMRAEGRANAIRARDPSAVPSGGPP